MKFFRYGGVLALLAMPAYAPAASREIQDLQRDVGLLEEQVKALQNSQNEKLSALTVLVQQAVDNANRANTGVAVIQNGFQQNLRDLENKVVAPVAGVGTRLDQMTNDFRTLQMAVSDLTSVMGRLQAQLTDLNNAVKVLQTPPAPPPSGAAPAGGPNAGLGSGGDTPTISATDLYQNALRDRTSGKVDLALQEFNDYLRWYGNTPLAPNAQFYIAHIHYEQGNYDDALKEFDMVLEKYPDNSKTPDALYYKGMSLSKQGHRTQGAEEFRELLKRYPSHDLAKQACTQLTGMGLKCVATRTSPAAPASRKKKS